MWERGEKLPSQTPNSLMRCACGETFDSHRLEHNLIHVPHITASQRQYHMPWSTAFDAPTFCPTVGSSRIA